MHYCPVIISIYFITTLFIVKQDFKIKLQRFSQFILFIKLLFQVCACSFYLFTVCEM